MRRSSAIVASLGLCGLLACGPDAGCGGTYDYPRADPQALPTSHAMRMRITQTGLDTIADGIPGLIAQSCADPTADTCAQHPTDPDRVDFYLGKPGEPLSFAVGLDVELRSGGAYPLDVEFDTTLADNSPIEDRFYCDDNGAAACSAVRTRGTGTSGNGFCRDPDTDSSCNDPDNDFCCGDAAPHLCGGAYSIDTCTAPRSTFGLDLASLAGRIKLGLVQDPQGGGIQVIVGCDRPNANDCTDRNEWVRGFFDMVMRLDAGDLIGDYACYVQDDVDPVEPTEPLGFELRSMRFTIKPRIELGADGKPYLELTQGDVSVQAFDLEVYLSTGPALTDPACYDEGWGTRVCGSFPFLCADPSSDPFSDCTGTLGCGAVDFLSRIMVPILESDTFASVLALQLATTMLGAFSEEALEAVGALDLSTLIPVGSRHANPVGYLLPANVDSPEVTSGGSGDLGLNFDFDAGFAAEHSACVPTVSCPLGPGGVCWQLGPMPDPGSTVMAPDPVTGTPTDEAFDLSMLIGDALVERATFELFDGGGFCLDLGARSFEELTAGAFIPTVGGMGVLVPGLLDLAPLEAPVDLRLVPRLPPRVFFGTGDMVGDVRDSHVQLVWPGLEIEMYPLVDDVSMRAVAFSLLLRFGMSFEPTPTGGLELMLDPPGLEDVGSTYDELAGSFDPQGFANLVTTFLPAIVSADPINVELTAAALGFPLVPKIRAVEARGQNVGGGYDYLAMFLRFCNADDIADTLNALCYEDPASSGSALRPDLHVERLAGPGGPELVPTMLRLRAFSDIPASQLQLSYRVGGSGPWYSFQDVEADGTFDLRHGLLATPGPHRVEVRGRDRNIENRWSSVAELVVVSDHWAPSVVLRRRGGVVVVEVVDDVTPAERVAVRAEIDGPNRHDAWDFAPRTEIAVAADERLTVWARDDAGNVSQPHSVAAFSAPATASVTEHVTTPAGCAGVTVGWAGLAAVLLLRRRRRRSGSRQEPR